MHLGIGNTPDVHPGLANICEQCQLPFMLLGGGMCSVCKRMLCKRHLFGLSGRFALTRPGPIVCRKCRRSLTKK